MFGAKYWYGVVNMIRKRLLATAQRISSEGGCEELTSVKGSLDAHQLEGNPEHF